MEELSFGNENSSYDRWMNAQRIFSLRQSYTFDSSEGTIVSWNEKLIYWNLHRKNVWVESSNFCGLIYWLIAFTCFRWLILSAVRSLFSIIFFYRIYFFTYPCLVLTMGILSLFFPPYCSTTHHPLEAETGQATQYHFQFLQTPLWWPSQFSTEKLPGQMWP